MVNNQKRNMQLTDKQKLFVKEYLIDLNATQAAIRAGYSEDTAAEQASRLLTKVKIKEEVQKGMDKRASKTEITAEYVLNGIKTLIENSEQENSKLKGYELLGKHLKLFVDKVETNIDGKLEIVMDNDMKELAK